MQSQFKPAIFMVSLLVGASIGALAGAADDPLPGPLPDPDNPPSPPDPFAPIVACNAPAQDVPVDTPAYEDAPICVIVAGLGGTSPRFCVGYLTPGSGYVCNQVVGLGVHTTGCIQPSLLTEQGLGEELGASCVSGVTPYMVCMNPEGGLAGDVGNTCAGLISGACMENLQSYGIDADRACLYLGINNCVIVEGGSNPFSTCISLLGPVHDCYLDQHGSPAEVCTVGDPMYGRGFCAGAEEDAAGEAPGNDAHRVCARAGVGYRPCAWTNAGDPAQYNPSSDDTKICYRTIEDDVDAVVGSYEVIVKQHVDAAKAFVESTVNDVPEPSIPFVYCVAPLAQSPEDTPLNEQAPVCASVVETWPGHQVCAGQPTSSASNHVCIETADGNGGLIHRAYGCVAPDAFTDGNEGSSAGRICGSSYPPATCLVPQGGALNGVQFVCVGYVTGACLYDDGSYNLPAESACAYAGISNCAQVTGGPQPFTICTHLGTNDDYCYLGQFGSPAEVCSTGHILLSRTYCAGTDQDAAGSGTPGEATRVCAAAHTSGRSACAWSNNGEAKQHSYQQADKTCSHDATSPVSTWSQAMLRWLAAVQDDPANAGPPPTPAVTTPDIAVPTVPDVGSPALPGWPGWPVPPPSLPSVPGIDIPHAPSPYVPLPALPGLPEGPATPPTPIDDDAPTLPIPSIPHVAPMVDAGAKHTCTMDHIGQVECYGSPTYGMTGPYEGEGAVRVSAGGTHTCVLLETRNIDCYGGTHYGQSADYLFGDAIDVSTGSSHTCALTAAGNIDCWGNNQYGQAADYVGGQAVAVSAGAFHTCALLNNGNVDCWGYDRQGAATDYLGGDATQVSAGSHFTCILRSTGNVDCQGDDFAGRATGYQGGDATAISAGGTHACAIVRPGGDGGQSDVVCWGDGEFGQADDRASGNAVMVTTGQRHTCILSQSGGVDCYGDNRWGQSFNHALLARAQGGY